MFISPNKKEIEAAEWMRSLFDFSIDVSYYIYDYGTRNCTIIIEASGEENPFVHSSDDRNDFLRGPNSIIVAKFAREKLKSLGITYYCALRGFMIPYFQVLKLKNTLCN